MTTYTNVKPSTTDLLTAISGVTDGEADAAERGWIESTQERQAEMEAQWRQQKCTWSWVDLQPKHLSHIEWYGYEDRQTGEIDEPGFLREPKVPCRVLFRLDMVGGGQVKVMERWVPWRKPDSILGPCRRSELKLHVAAHVGNQLRNYFGVIWRACSEMSVSAVVLQRRIQHSPDIQDIADRTAATFRTLSTETHHSCTPPARDNFYALLASGARCAICNRPLVDEISKLVCVGPDCAKRWSIPHSRGAASARLALRRQLLGKEE